MMSVVHVALVHILAELDLHRRRAQTSNISPLFVAIQGPQGCGKTYLTERLRQALESPEHSLSTAVLSIDDLYLPHAKLVALSEAHPRNPLLQGRGQPGTHDLELTKTLFEDFKHINDPPVDENVRRVYLPSFDKSLYGGAGDRVQSTVVKCAPVDVVIMEGWCVGFCPITQEEIDDCWMEVAKEIDYQKEDITELNDRLKDYVDWWHRFQVCIQIRPIPESSPFSLIYKWRLQQEHETKARNGGIGMSDAKVRSFVDRFIPGYIFFGDGVRKGTRNANGTRESPSWAGHGLAITIGEAREVLATEGF